MKNPLVIDNMSIEELVAYSKEIDVEKEYVYYVLKHKIEERDGVRPI